MKDRANSVLLTPGYAEAVERERLIRDAAFLPVSESVGGFELRPLTLRTYLMLRLAGSPLLEGQTPSVVELAQFLWVLAPSSVRGQVAGVGCQVSGVRWGWKRWAFFRRCRRTFVPPRRPLLRTRGAMRRWRKRRDEAFARAELVLREAREFVSETMQDRPGKTSKGFAPSYYSDVCFWWGTLGRNGYPMGLEELMELPLKALFQVMKEILDSRGESVGNPSDGVRGEYLKKLNEELRGRGGIAKSQ